MTSHTQEMPLLDQVLHLYDKASTKVLAYFTVLLVVTVTALTIDQGFGIPPTSVLVYVSILMAFLLIGGPIAYVAYRAFHRPEAETVSAPVSASLDNEPSDIESSQAGSVYRSNPISKMSTYIIQSASERGMRDIAVCYLPHQITGEHVITSWEQDLRRELYDSNLSAETILVLNRVLMATRTFPRPASEQGKSAEFVAGCDYGFISARQAFIRELMQILTQQSVLRREERPGGPLSFDPPLPDAYPGFFNPRKSK
ncbi:MAG TPA: hypothetical protein VMS31_01900 [Pyrinomonadaceae bacterium]|nr:hypothetical protein [Pyrinomonadaceae bacterium]